MAGSLTIAFVGWDPDKADVENGPGASPVIPDQANKDYLRALQILVHTMRDQYENRPHTAITTQLRIAADAEDLRAHVLRPADLLIYGGHAFLAEDGSPYLASELGQRLYVRDLRGQGSRGIRTAGLVLDCCYGASPEFRAALTLCLEQETAVLACTATAPHTHGPVLLPNLLARLACPKRPATPTPDSMLNLMTGALASVPTVWPGHWSRWTARLMPE